MKPRVVTVLDGSTFAVSDVQGDIAAGPGEVLGLFFRDMRHLSYWKLTLNGRCLSALSTANSDYDRARFFLTVPTGTVYRNPAVSIIRSRYVGDGMRERLQVLNDGPETTLELSVQFAADFADVFEVKDHVIKGQGHYARVEGDTVVLGYRREDFRRETHIRASGGFLTEQSVTFRLELASQGRWSTDIELSMVSDVGHHRVKAFPARRPRPNMGQDLTAWLGAAPVLDCDWDDLRHTYRRSLTDLAALRFYPSTVPGHESLPAAGLPWFMALFGRDSLITSYQALPFVPELARTTLLALAARQADSRDDFRDAEPGKVLHELRFGELTYFGQRPQSPYYGSADATPLFLILLDEYELWSGDAELVRRLEAPARAALGWLEDYGDGDGDGYVEYQRRNTDTGLVNQGWKDSWNSVVHPDGALASLPRATCELQGYAYDARLRCARLARRFWADGALADRLERRAAGLKDRFNEDFWVDEGGFFALALDGEKKQVITLTSNMGQLLWSGIIADEHADAVVGHLMGEQMFSGWGVRTMAAGQGAYNPIEYHNGTVWPHDNALIAAVLARYGRHEQAGRIATSILAAARFFDHRLPETFAGYPRALTEVPVEYPTACSPQAWAAGAPLLLLRVLLGLQPDGERLASDPHVPEQLGRLALSGIPGRWGSADIAG